MEIRIYDCRLVDRPEFRIQKIHGIFSKDKDQKLLTLGRLNLMGE